MLRRRSGEGGFTLIELVITMTILGVVMVSLAGVMVQYFRVTVTTQSRYNQSHDQQFAAAFWQQDVSSLGVSSFNASPAPGASPLTPRQSVWTTTAPTTGVDPYCATPPGQVIIGFTWIDYPGGGDGFSAWTGGIPNSAVYYISATGELSRRRCFGDPATSTTSSILARNLATKPVPQCTGGGVSGCDDKTGNIPTLVTLTMRTGTDTTSTCPPPSGTGYCTTLTAQRRQG